MYWVGKTTKNVPDPAAASPEHLPLEQELVIERSEPKWLEAGIYDPGQANFITGFDATGAVPLGAPCNPASSGTTIIMDSVGYYYFWKRVGQTI